MMIDLNFQKELPCLFLNEKMLFIIFLIWIDLFSHFINFLEEYFT